MATYGAYYYARADAKDGRPITARRPDAPGIEEVRSPAPARGRSPMPGYRGRSNSPSEVDRPMSRFAGPPAHLERPTNPSYGDRPAAGYVPPQIDEYRTYTAFAEHHHRPETAAPYTPPPARPPGRHGRSDSPDPSIVSDFSDVEMIRPNHTSVEITTYAKCLERVLSDPNLPMPMRVGLLGNWSKEKTRFVQGILWCLKQACDFNCHNIDEPLEPSQTRWIKKTCCDICEISYFIYLILLFWLFLLITAGASVFSVLGIYEPLTGNSQNGENATSVIVQTGSVTPEIIGAITVISVFVLILLISLFVVCCKDRYMRGIGSFFAHVRMFIIMALCETPPPPTDAGEKSDMIPVVFRISHLNVRDGDNVCIWAPLLTLISEKIENFFGFYKTRFYRASKKELLHLHDALIADERRWAQRTSTLNRANPYYSPIMASKLTHQNGAVRTKPFHTTQAPQRKTVSRNGTLTYQKPKPNFHTTRQQRVVGIEDLTEEKISIHVHSTKWRCIPYPILITILLCLFTISVNILVTSSLAVVNSSTSDFWLYILISISAAAILFVIISQIPGFLSLMSALCVSQSRHIGRIAAEARKLRRKQQDDSHIDLKVKAEINVLMGFIRQMEHVYQRKLRLLLIIDDFDRASPETTRAVLETLNNYLSDTSFPLVTLLNFQVREVIERLDETGVKNSRSMLERVIDMKFCIPEITIHDMGKLLDLQADHLICSTATTVNRIREEIDSRYQPLSCRQSRRAALAQMDKMFDLEETPAYQRQASAYFTQPLSARAAHTATGKRNKSSKSKKRVVFTPMKTSSEDGILEGPEDSSENSSKKPADVTESSAPTPPQEAHKQRQMTERKTSLDQSSSPSEARRTNQTPSGERPESVLSTRVKSPLDNYRMKRENSALTEVSSDEEDVDDPEWMLAMSAGESRKETKVIPTRRSQPTAELDKSPAQLQAQHAAALSELKHTFGVSSNNVLSLLVDGPRFSLKMNDETGVSALSLLPASVDITGLSAEKIKRHILSYGLRRRMMYIAMEELRNNFKVLDGSNTKLTQTFNSVFLSVYIWVQKLKQLAIVDLLMDDSQTEKVVVKLFQTCQELTRWVILCELWPYKCSWLAYKVERINRKMGDFPSSNFYLEGSIKDIYKDVKQDMNSAKEELGFWTEADYSTTLFKKSLEKYKDMSGQSVLHYLPFTPNLDRSMRLAIRKFMHDAAYLNKEFDDTPSSPTGKTISFADQQQEITS